MEMNNVIEMITQIGSPVRINTIKTWNPNISSTDIENCKELEIIGDMVSIKQATLDINELTFDQIIELVDEYNEKVKKDYKNYDEKQLKIVAMKKWLDERYEEVKSIEKTDLYELFEVKRKGRISSYVICDDFNEKIGQDLFKKYFDEDLNICSITRSYTNQLGYFSYMDAKDIISQNINKYELKGKQVEILKIEKENK